MSGKATSLAHARQDGGGQEEEQGLEELFDIVVLTFPGEM